MFGFGRNERRPIEEHEADGETERIYHELRQSLRVTGVNLIFRKWAAYERFFPVLWSALGPNVETLAFEEAADQLRRDATRIADRLGRLDLASRVRLGESQAFQLAAALDLYHYVNPKLLILASAVRLALDGEAIGRRGNGHEGRARVELGAPDTMPPMEMISEAPDDRRTREIFDDIRRTFGMKNVNSDYRTLALWPDYLGAVWEMSKPLMKREAWMRASDELRELSRSLARTLPHPIAISRARISEAGDDAEDFAETTINMERILPMLVLDMTLVALDWRAPDVLARSPFPARPRRVFEQHQGGVS